jgi:hypothetical protein
MQLLALPQSIESAVAVDQPSGTAVVGFGWRQSAADIVEALWKPLARTCSLALTPGIASPA